jgi:hypothetical protein
MPITPVHSSAQPYDASMTGALDAWRALGRRLDPQDPRVARDAAALLTSQLFFAPLLAEMRRLPFGREFGHGGRMEEAFGEQLDLHIADAVARSDQSLTASLTEKLMATRQPGNQATRQPGNQATGQLASLEQNAQRQPAPPLEQNAQRQPAPTLQTRTRAAGTGGDK